MTTYGATDRPGSQLLRVRFTELSIEAKAAVLQLEPLVDRREYNVLLGLEQQLAHRAGGRGPATPDGRPAARTSARWPSASRTSASSPGTSGLATTRRCLETMDPTARANVLDIGGFGHPRERLSVALAVLDHLWDNRERRQPVLLVIDEAHNVCLADPVDPLARGDHRPAHPGGQRGPQVRHLDAALHAATVADPPGSARAVRQPRADADELARRPARARAALRVRPAGDAAGRADVPPGRVPDGRRFRSRPDVRADAAASYDARAAATSGCRRRRRDRPVGGQPRAVAEPLEDRDQHLVQVRRTWISSPSSTSSVGATKVPRSCQPPRPPWAPTRSSNAAISSVEVSTALLT